MRRARGAGRWRAACLGVLASPAWAHRGEPPEPHDLWRWEEWPLEPQIAAPVLLLAGLYALGVWRVWRRAGRGRGLSARQVASGAAGLALLALALLTPLHRLGEALFSAHMAQHTILLLLCAPLLVLGRPGLATLWALPAPWRRPLARLGRRPPMRAGWRALVSLRGAALLHGLALWVWHAPSLYQATLEDERIHALQHLSFLLAGLLFWHAVFRAARRANRIFLAVLAVFVTAAHGSLLGALLTFAPAPLYPVYSGRTEAFGLSLIEDQQLGGLIMWVPGGVVYLGASLYLLARGLKLLGARSAAAARGGRAVWPLLLLVLGGCPPAVGPTEPEHPDPERGRALLSAYGCTGCHQIPGVAGANRSLGPPLEGFARRALIAGRVPNDGDWLERWIVDPQGIDPGTAMPDLRVEPLEARDMAVYLRGLR